MYARAHACVSRYVHMYVGTNRDQESTGSLIAGAIGVYTVNTLNS